MAPLGYAAKSGNLATHLAVSTARDNSAVGGEDEVADALGVSEPHVAELGHLRSIFFP